MHILCIVDILRIYQLQAKKITTVSKTRTNFKKTEKKFKIQLLDKVTCAVVGDFQKCQRHLMLKKLYIRPYIL